MSGNQAVNSAAKVLNNAANTAVNAVANTFNSAANAFNLDSLVPLGNNKGNAKNNTKANNNLFASLTKSEGNNAKNLNVSTPGWVTGVGAFAFLVLIFLAIFTWFKHEIKVGVQNLIATLRDMFGLRTEPPIEQKEEIVTEEVTSIPEPPQDLTPAQEKQMETPVQALVEAVLPLGASPEVFNVSQNNYTYYDAEPLCRAMGAELATYDQVKDAWEKGADWCNYGWVKGQVAVYPTQEETWDKLQAGPADQRGACGVPGLNGGHFDNPEMRFGVNCYGPKPPQSSHDESMLAKNGRIPRTPLALKADEKVLEYKSIADSVGVLPFNENKWGTA